MVGARGWGPGLMGCTLVAFSNLVSPCSEPTQSPGRQGASTHLSQPLRPTTIQTHEEGLGDGAGGTGGGRAGRSEELLPHETVG